MLLAAYLDSLASSGNTQLAFVFTTLIVWDASANGVAAALMIISQKKTHYFLGKVVLFEVHIILIVVFLVLFPQLNCFLSTHSIFTRTPKIFPTPSTQKEKQFIKNCRR